MGEIAWLKARLQGRGHIETHPVFVNAWPRNKLYCMSGLLLDTTGLRS